MLQEAAARTAWLSLSLAVLVPVLQVAQWWLQPQLYAAALNDASRLATLAMVLWAAGLFALHRYHGVGPSAIVSLGMAFEVFGAFAIAMVETAVLLTADQPVLGVSKLAPWILAFGVFIPNRPRWTLLCASAAAGTWPIAYAINAAIFDDPALPSGWLGVWPLFNGCMVVLAYMMSRQTFGMALATETAVELGSYRLVAPIGQGSMGEVWRASHQLLARPAAIKLIRTQGGSGRQADLAARRFRREAEAIAKLQSPHTVYLYDFGVSHDGRFYYAMELLDGVSLQALVTTFGPQPAARVLPILIQICRPLDEAHRHGIVHRDLKPSNVALCEVAFTYDFVKVLDFGLAKFVDNPEISQLTLEGMATGTPGYVAPEVASGKTSIDGRADVYAVGCIAYFLLTGALVFEETNPMKMLLKHVSEPPVPPSARTGLPIPDALERIVLQCLAKAPGDRPASAAELAAMLTACSATRWTDADAEAWWGRHLPATSPLRSFATRPIDTPTVVRTISLTEG